MNKESNELLDFLIGDKIKLMEIMNEKLTIVNSKRKLIIDKMAEIDLLFGEIYDESGSLSNLCIDIISRNNGCI